MTIIGVDDQKDTPTSPPTYAEVAASMPRPVQSAVPPNVPPSVPSSVPPSVPTHSTPQAYGPPRAYGPTPLPAASSQAQTTTALPYYDPRSPWAMQAAVGRAQRRFFGALFWACIIWLAVGSLVGGAVDDVRRRQTDRRGSWAVE